MDSFPGLLTRHPLLIDSWHCPATGMTCLCKDTACLSGCRLAQHAADSRSTDTLVDHVPAHLPAPASDDARTERSEPLPVMSFDPTVDNVVRFPARNLRLVVDNGRGQNVAPSADNKADRGNRCQRTTKRELFGENSQ